MTKNSGLKIEVSVPESLLKWLVIRVILPATGLIALGAGGVSFYVEREPIHFQQPKTEPNQSVEQIE